MENLFTWYRETKFKAGIGVLRHLNILSNPKKTIAINGIRRYGELIQDQIFGTNNELLYCIDFFTSYDNMYKYIKVRDLNSSKDYEEEYIEFQTIENNLASRPPR